MDSIFKKIVADSPSTRATLQNEIFQLVVLRDNLKFKHNGVHQLKFEHPAGCSQKQILKNFRCLEPMKLVYQGDCVCEPPVM